jgi:hypothetical protein
MAYKEIKGDLGQFVNLEVNEQIEGRLEAIKEGTYGDNYDIVKSDGTKVTLGSKSALGNRIKESMVGRGVRITRLEDQKSKNGRMFQNFKVEVEE